MAFYGYLTDQMNRDGSRILDRAHDNRLARQARRWDETEATEALACPACATEYDFGNDCIDCDLPLASASLASTAGANAPLQTPAERLAESLVFALAGAGAVVLLAVFWVGYLRYF